MIQLRRLCRLALLPLFVSGLAIGQGFQTAAVVPVSGDPNALASGDFNGNGNPDLVYQDAGHGGNLHVLLGNGDGSFRAGQVIAVPLGTGGVIDVGDLNGDGIPDLVLNGNNQSMTVLLGKGDGSFLPPTSFPAPLDISGISAPGHVGVADFDGDGHADVLFSDQYGYLYLMRGDGKGNLAAPVQIPAGGEPGDVLVADLNGDGLPDVVVPAVGSFDVFLNQGHGAFAPFVSYPISGYVLEQKALGLADVNGDGHPDVIYSSDNTNGRQIGGQVMVAYGNADGTFQPAVALANTGQTFFSVAGVADLKGDGRPRVFFSISGAVATALGASPANAPLYAATGVRATQTLIADFNRDGYMDIAVAGQNTIVILFGKADGTFTAAPVPPVYGVGGETVLFADTNGDGKPDAIAGGITYLGNGDGTFSATPVQVGGAEDDPLYLANFNGHGKVDFFDTFKETLGNGDGTFKIRTVAGKDTPFFDALPATFGAVADFDGDGLSDPVATSTENGNFPPNPSGENIAVWLSSTSQFVYLQLPLSEVAGPVVTGDFDHDGCQDFAVAGTAHIFLYKGNCQGGFTQTVSYATGVAPNGLSASIAGTSSPADLAAADLDGDGNLDLVYTIPSLSEAAVLYGNGDGTFTPAAAPIPLSRADMYVSAADLDGDGLADLVLSGGSLVSVVYGQGGRQFSPELLLAAGPQTGRVSIADLNLDGKPDIGVAAAGSLSVFLNHAPAANTTGISASLGFSPEPSVYGSAGQGTVTLTPVNSTAVPTGFVSISVDGVPFGTAAVKASGTAVFPLNGIAAGSHMISVTYQGDVNFRTALATGAHTVTAAPSTTLVSASPNPSTTLQAIALTAVVSASGAVPAGSVEFFDGGSALGTANLDVNGHAMLAVPELAAGAHTITASYAATQNFQASTGSASEVVTLLPTATAISLPRTVVRTGAGFVLAVTVSGSGTSVVPTGSISCAAGTVGLGSATLSNGTAELYTTQLPVGTDAIACSYSGDPNFAASTSSTVNVTVTPETTSGVTLNVTSAGSAVTSVMTGTAVTLTAQVAAGGSPVTIGQVRFCDAGAPCSDVHLVGTAQLTSAGTAVLRFVPGPGSHSYLASFGGTATAPPGESTVAGLTVTGSTLSTFTLAETGTPGSYSLTATLSGTGAVPTGNVSLVDLTNAGVSLASAPLMAASGSFTFQGSNLVTPASISGVAHADFNGDGIPDLAIASGNAGQIVIYLGKGDGTFAAGQTLQAAATGSTGSQQAYAVIAADFNGDGKLDVAAMNNNDNNLYVFLGNGDGTFGANALKNTATEMNTPSSLAVSDFDGDGIPDIAGASESGNTGIILLGNGDGTFRSAASVPLTSPPRTVVTGDFNGDGIADLAFSTRASGTIVLMLGHGDGTFTPAPSNPITPSYPVSLAVGDFNGDGVADLAVTSDGYNNVSILLGNGDGTFNTQSTTYATDTTPSDITVGDFNGDGKPDVAVANESSNTVTVLLGNGDGTFSASRASVGVQPEFVISADLNGDGHGDLVVGNVQSGYATVLLAQGTSSASATISGVSPTGTGTHRIQASYGGDSSYGAAVSNAVNLTAQPVTTALSLTTNMASASYGQQVMLTATLAPFSVQGLGTDGETITFLDGSTTLGTALLKAGVATLNTATLTVGTHTLTATYAGDGNFAGSSSATVGAVVSVAQQTIAFALPATASYGSAPIALSAQATSGLPVSFSVVSGPATVSSGTLSFTSSGTVVIAADQAGNAVYAAAPEVKQTIVVNPATVSINWPQPAAIAYGANLSSVLNATALNGGTTVAGTFAYVQGSSAVTSATVLPAGTYTLDVNFAPSDTTRYTAAIGNVNLTVNKAVSSVALTSGASAIFLGNALTLTATVSPGPGATGSVMFASGTTVLGSAVVSGGVATLSVSMLPTGSQTLTAVYSGDANFTGSSSGQLTEIVQDFTVSSSAGSPDVAASGDAATYAFGIGPSSGTTFPGVVTFSVSGLPPGATATFTPQSLPAGSGQTNVTMTIQLGPQAQWRDPGMRGRRLPSTALALLLLPFSLGFGMSERLRPQRLRSAMRCILLGVFCMASVGALAGCGSSSNAVSAPTPSPRSYVLTITATSGSLSHSITTTLQVP